MPSLRVIGPGRAGRSLATALGTAGWQIDRPLSRRDDLAAAARGVDLLVMATPDSVVAEVAGAVEPGEATVAHLAGSLGLDVLSPHPRRAALHPLVALPDPEVGARRLSSGAWFGLAGDPPEALAVVQAAVSDLGGRSFVVDDAHRSAYHAAAVIASNHLVGLLAQAERVAATAGVPLEAYLDLVRTTVDNVAELGPAGALTGPVARGDWSTVERHRTALDDDQREAYDAMVELLRRLADARGTRRTAPGADDRTRG